MRVHRFVLIAWLSQRRRRSKVRVPAMAVVPERALAIWKERADLRAEFNLTRASGRAGLFWWYLIHGFRELGFEPSLDEKWQLDVVNQPLPNMEQRSFVPITWLMREMWRRKKPQDHGPLRYPKAQKAILVHYFARWLGEANLWEMLTKEQAQALLSHDTEHPKVTRILCLIWQSDEDLQRRFPSPEDTDFFAWCLNAGASRFPILSHPMIGLAPHERPLKLVCVPFRAPPNIPPCLHKGVNLIGHVHARSGVGEDVRMAARALASQCIPFEIYNVSAGPAIGDEDHEFDRYLSNDLRYATNIFCMDGVSTVAAIVALGGRVRETHRNIGFWPWELPEWPELLRHVFGYVDEVWTSSRFTQAAFARSSSVPIRHVPIAVTAEESDLRSRIDFGLPADLFLFAYAFDGLSTYARKNPLAVVKAFQLAFPEGAGPVGLVLKCLRATADPIWKELQQLIAGDPRIYLVTDTLTRGQLLDLYSSLDCFVSLHRSEGFGRNIAEFMLLGKPVIVTAHSGNMDFTRHDTAALIPARLTPVRPGEYPFGTGQMWADPDVAAAAAAMRRMMVDRAWRENLATNGRQVIECQYAPQVVGKAWIEALGHRLDCPASVPIDEFVGTDAEKSLDASC